MKNIIRIIMVGIISSTLILPLYANEPSLQRLETKPETVQNKLDEKRSIREQLLKKLREQRCERITERVQNKINGYEKNKEVHILRYKNIEKRIEKLILEVKEIGLDTTKLEEDLKEYKEMVNSFIQKYNLFVNSIKGVKTLACSEQENENGFKNNVEQSRMYLREAREQAKKIHTFVKDELIEDLRILREQYQQAKLNENTNE